MVHAVSVAGLVSQQRFDGNVREVRNVLVRAARQVACSARAIVGRSQIEQVLSRTPTMRTAAADEPAEPMRRPSPLLPSRGSFRDPETAAWLALELVRLDGNQSELARRLGVKRTTVRHWLGELGLTAMRVSSGQARS